MVFQPYKAYAETSHMELSSDPVHFLQNRRAFGRGRAGSGFKS